jgi:hypothetical protein
MRKILISFLLFHGEVYMLEKGSMKRPPRLGLPSCWPQYGGREASRGVGIEFTWRRPSAVYKVKGRGLLHSKYYFN